MKAARVTAWGSSPEYIDVPNLEPPSHDEIQLKVMAVGIPRAVKGRAAGKHPSASGAPLPYDPSVDGVGLDEATGELYFVNGLVAPLLAQRANVAKKHLVKLPATTDTVALAALINPVSSSWMALRSRVSGGCEDRTVAIVGATSASGRSAAQVARALGAKRVIGLARNEATLAQVPGLDERVVLKEEEGASGLLESVGPIDIMLDYVGGPTSIELLKSAQIAPGADLQYVIVGGLAGHENMVLPVRLINVKPIKVMASGVGSVPKETIWRDTKELVTMIPRMGRFLDVHAVPMSKVNQHWDADSTTNQRLVILPQE